MECECEHPQDGLPQKALGPLVNVWATHTNKKKDTTEQKKTSAATTNPQKFRESETTHWFRAQTTPQPKSLVFGATCSEAPHKNNSRPCSFITERNKKNGTCIVWCALLTHSVSLNANSEGQGEQKQEKPTALTKQI